MNQLGSRFPRLDQVLGLFHMGFESEVLDADLYLEHLLWADRENGHLSTVVSEIDDLAGECPDEETAARALREWLSMTGLPDATSYREFLLHVRARAHGAQDGSWPVADSRGYSDLVIPRAGRFLDEEAANGAARDVLRAHERQVRAWADDGDGLALQYYVADVGDVVGKVLRQGQEEPEPVAWTAVVMARRPETGDVYVYDAYPEIVLDQGPAERWPDLPHLFGGYFGDVPDRPWPAQLTFQRETRDPARRRIARQLDDLLELDDADLRHAVESLGSYVLPETLLRRWVERIRWRMDAFDWTSA